MKLHLDCHFSAVAPFSNHFSIKQKTLQPYVFNISEYYADTWLHRESWHQNIFNVFVKFLPVCSNYLASPDDMPLSGSIGHTESPAGIPTALFDVINNLTIFLSSSRVFGSVKLYWSWHIFLLFSVGIC